MRLVLLHGFTGGAASFAHLGLDAVTPLLPGHGDAPDATGWDTALDALSPMLQPGPVVLCGYSMGARLALALALRVPVARLVLLSGTGGIEDETARAQRRAADEERAQMLEQQGLEAFLDRWEAHPTLAALQRFPELRAQRLHNRPRGLASALRNLGTGSMPPLWNAVPALQTPVTLIAGADDPKFAADAQRLHELLPRSTLHLLAGCGHAPHLERPADVIAALQGGLA